MIGLPAGIAAAVSAGASVLDPGHAAIGDYRDLAVNRLADGSLSIRPAGESALPSNASPVRFSYGLPAASERV